MSKATAEELRNQAERAREFAGVQPSGGADDFIHGWNHGWHTALTKFADRLDAAATKIEGE